MGAYHLAKKSGNFGSRSNGKQIFGKSFRKCGQPPEVVHFSVQNGNREIRYPGHQRFFSRAAGIFGVGQRPTQLRPL